VSALTLQARGLLFVLERAREIARDAIE